MSAYIPVELQRQVRARFFNACAYCRTAERLTGMTFEFEHIKPRVLGGETRFENLCFACPNCNRAPILTRRLNFKIIFVNILSK